MGHGGCIAENPANRRFRDRKLFGDLFDWRTAFVVFNDGGGLHAGPLQDGNAAHLARVDFDQRTRRPVDRVPRLPCSWAQYSEGERCENRSMRIEGPMLFGVLALAGCRSTPPPTPLAELNAQQTAGHAVFQTRCSVCHYDRQSGPLHGPSLLGVFKKQALPSGAAATDERVSATISAWQKSDAADGERAGERAT